LKQRAKSGTIPVFFALAAYNAGPGRVAKYRKQGEKLDYTMAYKTAYDQALLREKGRKTKAAG
jgi:soluble lytic murein transglycosylase-like protein